nr:putative ribonuclease H-like domain-containing protein [Tanacetum cinerariifolium]
MEKLVNKKVKIIRCDNGIEFKNSVMNDFCAMKGIRREFSVARTPQQNGVAERRNRTLIEAARSTLADSKLPATFCAEAVNTACYVQNMVLVSKPRNKTPYELFRGRTPASSLIRPFGCHVTILNTLYHLEKFNGKSDNGFFVGYSLNSKAFRVYNTRTRKVEENLHVWFLKDKAIIAGDEPKWLFDIDVPQDYDVSSATPCFFVHVIYAISCLYIRSLSVMLSRISFHVLIRQNAGNDEPQPSSDAGNKDHEGVSKESRISDQKRLSINTASPNVNTDGPSINTASTNDNAKVDLSIISTTYLVPSIPNTRIYKDHSLDHVIGDVQSGVQTRRMTKTTNEKGIISTIYERKAYEDLYTCLFACFLSQEEPKKLIQALKDLRCIEAMQEELLFEDLEFLDKVYKVEKALYGLHQAPRARFKGDILLVQVYVDDIIFGFTWKEMRTEFEKMMYKKFQMSSIGKLTFFLALQVAPKDDGIFINHDKYLKGQPKLGIWYPKQSPFDLEAYTDSDYAGASFDRKSTTRGFQFLWSRLISWKYKKQTVVANSTIKADYVASASCCRQVLWIQNQVLDYRYNFINSKIFIDNESTICIVNNLVFHSKTKNIEIRHHFIRDSNEKKLIQMIKIHTDHNVADLLRKAFDVGRFQYLVASIGMLNL